MDTSKENNIELSLKQKERELYSIQKIGQALSSTLKLDDLLLLIMKEITELMEADRSTLYLLDLNKKEVWSKIALKAEIREIRQKFGCGISGFVAATGETINITDAYKDVRFDPSTDARTGYTTRSILCMPVWEPDTKREKRQIVGVIQVLNKKSGFFSLEDEGILAAICSQVAISLANARLYQQLENKYREIDLLHAFEQNLSSEFDINAILKKMLQSTVNRLSVGLAGIVYPINGNIFLLGLNADGQFSEKKYPSANNSIQELFISVNKKNEPVLKEMLFNYFKILEMSDSHLFNYISTKLNEETNEQILVFLLSSQSSVLPVQEQHDEVLEIFGQKIVRALEIHKLREDILQKERLSAIGQMMSRIVHDLRSPINSIFGFTELLVAEGITPEEIKEYTDIILMEIQSLSNMIKEILDFAKGKTSILPRKCVAQDILKRFKPQLEQLFRKSAIEVEISNTSKKLIYADIEKCTRMFYNIAKNSKEAMKVSGIFSCKIFDNKDQVIFELTDNGPGIPEEIRHRLFESFVSSGKEKGTGLGLAIVKKIVDDHHGKIEIKSELGKGTLFRITFPEYQFGE